MTDAPPNRPKRPRHANQLAKFIVDVATGEEPEDIGSAESEGGKRGGKARAEALSDDERAAIARKAARARWGS